MAYPGSCRSWPPSWEQLEQASAQCPSPPAGDIATPGPTLQELSDTTDDETKGKGKIKGKGQGGAKSKKDKSKDSES